MNKKIGLIIGGNRGIGKALAQALATHWGSSGKVYLTARRASEALAAQQDLEQITGLQLGSFVFDLSEALDPRRVSNELQVLHGGLDIIVQNGAYLPRAGYSAIDDARPMIDANSHGTLRVLEAFLPLLREHGHMLIVASALGVLENLPEHLRAEFNTRSLDPRQINDAIDRYVDAVEAGKAADLGWPDWVNIPSKVAQVAVTRSFARQSLELGLVPLGASVNAVCPGVTLTDATRPFMGTVFNEEEAQSPEAAADGLMKILNLAESAVRPQGELIQHGKVIPFGD